MGIGIKIFLYWFALAQAQVLVPMPYWRGLTNPTIAPANPVYFIAGTTNSFFPTGGMGVYNWSITPAAITDGAAITYSFPSDGEVFYDARLTLHTTDTLTMTTPGFANITRTITTYDTLTINPTAVLLLVNGTQSFNSTGGCLNGTNCTGGVRTFSIASGVGSINASTGLYTASSGSGTAVVQVADTIGNVATANVTVTSSLSITPLAAKIPVYSSGIFSVVAGTAPYAFTVLVGTGAVACRSTLSANHNTTVVTISVLDTTGCPAVGSITIGAETICYTATTGTAFTGAIRGCNGTIAGTYIIGTAYNPTSAVYTAPTMIGSATVRVTDTGVPTAGTSDAAVTILRPVDIKVGQYFACVLYDEGSVKCWGVNSNGQLGLGSTITVGDSGVEVGANNNFVSLGTGRFATKIAVGLTHACALLDNSSLKCWGNGGSGRLGYGNTTSYGAATGQMGDSLPVVSLGTGKSATQIFAFGSSTCAILNDATVKCWGLNSSGQLGTGTNLNIGDSAGEMGNNLAVVNLGTGRTAVKLVGGVSYICALLDNASVKCWGRNDRGQLGQGHNNTLGNDPNEMGDNLPAVNVGAGRTAFDIIGLYESVCVKRDNNTMICWGRGDKGQLGNGGTAHIGDDAGEMAAIASINMNTGFGTLSNIYAIGRGSCAEDISNVVRCWGENSFGQLLLGNTTDRTSPSATNMSLGTGLVISKMVGSLDIPCVLFSNDRIKCFGRATSGAGTTGVFLSGTLTNNLGDAVGELGDSLRYLNH